MQTQTIFKAGNSNVVAIPKDLMKDIGIKKGQKITITKTSDGDALLIQKADKAATQYKKSPKVSAEFQKWLDTFIEENGEILDELAVR